VVRWPRSKEPPSTAVSVQRSQRAEAESHLRAFAAAEPAPGDLSYLSAERSPGAGGRQKGESDAKPLAVADRIAETRPLFAAEAEPANGHHGVGADWNHGQAHP
jgi:hypothetical protein